MRFIIHTNRMFVVWFSAHWQLAEVRMRCMGMRRQCRFDMYVVP
jgi:hypothetical protein